MPISPFSAALTACEESGWTVTNLHLNKLLFFAQKARLGRTDGVPLLTDTFEAWDLGPVVPRLYFKLRKFGSGLVENVFNVDRNLDLPEHAIVREVVRYYRAANASDLVDLSHREGGAWARNYISGVRGISIPNEDILREYRRDQRSVAA